MLDKTSFSTTPPRRQLHPRGPATVTGQSVAKRPRDPHSRAQLAAHWILGALTIQKPTARQAANLFGACEALIRRERRLLEATTSPPASRLEAAWASASPAERAAFARGNLTPLWDLIDAATR
jgi:hypothetical protein